MASLALARPNFRTRCNVFDVNPVLLLLLFPMSDMNQSESLGLMRVLFPLPLWVHAADDVWVLEWLEGF